MIKLEYHKEGTDARIYYHKHEGINSFRVEVSTPKKRRFFGGKNSQKESYKLLKEIVKAGIGSKEANEFFESLKKPDYREAGQLSVGTGWYMTDLTKKEMTVEVNYYDVNIEAVKQKLESMNQPTSYATCLTTTL